MREHRRRGDRGNQVNFSHCGWLLPSVVLTFCGAICQATVGTAEDRTEYFVQVTGAEAAPTKFKSYEEAWSIGVGFHNARRFAESQTALEAAVKLAPNDELRLKAYEALLPVYRVVSESEKMLDACDFILRKTDSDPKRSLTRSALLSFAYERGKIDVVVQRYEKVLKKDAKDRTALYVLSELYDRVKRDPQLAADYTKRLLALSGASDAPVDVPTSAKLAAQYVRQKEYRQGAELFEKIAPLDESLAAWNWKEAATAWLKVGEKEKALAAAKNAAASSAEKRSELLVHFWHRHVGEVFLATGEPALAITHLEKAIESTKIEGYVNDCKIALAKAREAVGAN